MSVQYNYLEYTQTFNLSYSFYFFAIQSVVTLPSEPERVARLVWLLWRVLELPPLGIIQTEIFKHSLVLL